MVRKSSYTNKCRRAARGIESVPPTRQERSRETLERILAAAERMLDTREFGELGMAELAREADCAVGTLYGRIPGKQVLLTCLFDLHANRHDRLTAELVAQGDQLPLRGRAFGIVEAYLKFYLHHSGLVRTVLLHLYREGPELDSFRRRSTRSFRELARHVARAPDIRHPQPELASELGLLAVLAVIQNRTVFGDRSGVQRTFRRERLKEELANMLVAYLAHPPTD